MIDGVHDVRYVVGECDFDIDDVGVGRESASIGHLVTIRLGLTVVGQVYSLGRHGLFLHGIHDCEGVGFCLVVEKHLDCKWSGGVLDFPGHLMLFRCPFDDIEVTGEPLVDLLIGPIGRENNGVTALKRKHSFCML